VATLDEVEAALWRRGLDAAAVDEVLALVRAVVAVEAGEGAGRLGQAGSGARSGERLSEGMGTGGEVEPRPGGSGEPDPGSDPGPELAGRQAGSAVGEGPGTGSDARPHARWTVGPLSREGVSTAPDLGSVGPVKTCWSCGERQPLAGFYRDANKVDGRRGTCKRCEGARRRVRRRELAAVRWLVAAGADPWELLAAAERRVPQGRGLGVPGTVAGGAVAEASALDLEALADALRSGLAT
jgi:hypothetical protein